MVHGVWCQTAALTAAITMTTVRVRDETFNISIILVTVEQLTTC